MAPPSPQPQVALQANNQRSGSSCELFELRTSIESGQIPEVGHQHNLELSYQSHCGNIKGPRWTGNHRVFVLQDP